jgi:shikimate dehydrogenase
MRKFGLIGYPLGHSFSQKYFTEKFALEKIADCSYQNFPLKHIEEFPDLIRKNPDLCGLNVTLPYKTAILNYIDAREAAIDEIGAVNVLKFKRIGGIFKIYGFNSDVTGIRDSILPYLNDNVKNVMILGTGGSSRAVNYTMKILGLNVTLVSRNRKHGVICYRDLTPGLIRNTDIIINTTPLGMFPDISTKPDINYDLLKEKHILFDLVYNPEYTSFLKMGKERGCKIITGLTMLYSQADRSWEIWNEE